MLPRIVKRNFRTIVRYLSDKSPPEDEKLLEKIKEKPKTSQFHEDNTATPNEVKLNKADDDVAKNDTFVQEQNRTPNKIKSLLKDMLSEPRKISDEKYRETFVTAPDKKPKQKIENDELKMKNIEKSITKAAEEVAKTIGGDVKKTEDELLSRVLGKINKTSTSLSDLLTGMKIDRSVSADKDDMEIRRDKMDLSQINFRGQRVKQLTETAKSKLQKYEYKRKEWESVKEDRSRRDRHVVSTVNIFNGTPLGIFKKREQNYGTKLGVWDTLTEREIILATTQPPANYFQKMILWTEQGKVWKFPINNEQGMEEEQTVHFSEHIFLDRHLEGWCPKKGPIRHFMELVCIGLSKNAFYTVQEKQDHINWYKEYFESKKDLLSEVGAWHNVESNEKVKTSTE